MDTGDSPTPEPPDSGKEAARALVEHLAAMELDLAELTITHGERDYLVTVSLIPKPEIVEEVTAE